MKLSTLIIAAACLLTASCDRSSSPFSPREPEESETNGGQQPGNHDPSVPDDDNRPGLHPDTEYAAILADETPRIESTQFSLRFGEPGIMVAHDGDKTISFIDIDTDRRTDFSHLGLNADSTLLSPTLTINGVIHTISGRMLKSTSTIEWYVLTETSADRTSTHIAVIPQL